MKRNNNTIGIVYKVTNVKTKEVYIGITTKSIEDRKKDHIQKANKGGGYFQEAIGTYSPNSFIWEQIDTANSLDELAEKEKQYIIKYDTINNGYNSDCGGGFMKTVYQYDVKGNLISTYRSLNDIKISNKRRISNACLNGNIHNGFYWSYAQHTTFIPKKDLRLKKVGQYDLLNNLVKEYKSVAEASNKTGISKTCISRCCRGERENSGGFIWKYN
jgi:hypothetical protein